MEPIWALGFMSGTSLDGIDAAFILSDGLCILDKGPTSFLAYEPEFRQEVRQCFGQPEHNSFVRQVEVKLTRLHAELAHKMIEETSIAPQLIGFHGQTIFHVPPKTLQIGDGELLSELVRVPVVYDFRSNDCLNGGQGAPLVPIYHQALAKSLEKPLAIVNIGGVGNITYMDDSETLIAFDTGPGNALIDDFVLQAYGIPFDKDGAIAARGIADQLLVQSWLKEAFFTKSYPKSLDRNHFSMIKDSLAQMSPADSVATLTLFTASTIALACAQLPKLPKQLVLCGGGAKNQTLQNFLEESLNSTSIITAQSLGWESDFVEAQAFAFLAIRSFYGLPISFPLTTGVKVPLTGGRIIETMHNGSFERLTVPMRSSNPHVL